MVPLTGTTVLCSTSQTSAIDVQLTTLYRWHGAIHGLRLPAVRTFRGSTRDRRLITYRGWHSSAAFVWLRYIHPDAPFEDTGSRRQLGG